MNLIWKLLLTTTLALSGIYMPSISAQTSPSLSGRWELTDEVQPDDDVITSIQFEKGQRMIFETIENNRHFIREAAYATQDSELIISMVDDQVELPFLLSNSSLSLELNSSQTLNFARSQSLRQYHRFAIDTSTGNYLTVSDINLDIQINGSQALTTVTYEIFNGGNDDAEAELNIPLPSSAQVIGYALDIQGVMVDGVIVPKEDARNAFNTIESQSIDPGIAEITKGNAFRTEIYPVLPGSSRTIRIEYIETLASQGDDQVKYRFPLSRYSTASAHDVAVKVNGASSRPVIANSSAALAGTVFDNNGDEYSLGFELNNQLKKTNIPDLEFSFLPQTMQHPTRTKFKDGRAYFSVTQQLEDADFKPATSNTNSVAVFWDASTSMEVHHQSNLNLLAAFINQNSIFDETISITIFANEILDTQVFTPSKSRNQSILSIIDDLIYDGGTRFAAISQELSRHTTDYGLLFSDGIGSLGSYDGLTPAYPLYTLTGEGAIDEPFLRQLATRSNGLFLKYSKGNYGRLLSFIGKQAPEIDLTLSNKRKPGNLHYELNFGKTVTLNVTGTIHKSSTTLATAINKSRFKKNRFSKATIDEGGLTKHQWARMALNKLLVNRLKNENNIRDFGLTHSLITPFTSLIVLERIEDYAEYGIEPSPTLPYADEYPALRKEVLLERQVTKRTEEKTIQELLYQWEFRTLWWKLENPTTLKAALQAYTPPIEIQVLFPNLQP